MVSAAAGGSVDYNIQSDLARRLCHELSRRQCRRRESKFTTAGTLLGTATVTFRRVVHGFHHRFIGGWRAKTLHVVLGSNAQHLNWVEFVANNHPTRFRRRIADQVLSCRPDAAGHEFFRQRSGCSAANAHYQFAESSAPAPPLITIAACYVASAIAQSPSTHTVTVAVSDNGTPGSSPPLQSLYR